MHQATSNHRLSSHVYAVTSECTVHTNARHRTMPTLLTSAAAARMATTVQRWWKQEGGAGKEHMSLNSECSVVKRSKASGIYTHITCDASVSGSILVLVLVDH